MAHFEFVESKRGGRLILFNGYLFRIKIKRNFKMFYHCNTEGCKASLAVENENTIIRHPGDHNHVPNVKKQLKKVCCKGVKSRYKKKISTQVPRIYRLALAKASADGASTSSMPSDNYAAIGYDIEKKGWTNSSSDQGNDETITPDVERRSSDSASTNLLSSSDIVVKQEIIETELESSIFDDTSFHSSIADGPFETQFDGQRPSTSFVTCSESSNSHTDILPRGQTHVFAQASTLPQGLRTVKVESDVPSNSFGVISENNCTSSTRNESIQPGVPSHIPSSFSPIRSSSHGGSCNNESTQPKVPSHSNTPFRSRDRFDAFGELIASKLRNLDPKSSVFIQTTFANLLFKAELGISNRDENGVSDVQTDDIGKATSPPNEFGNPSGKENIQPEISSLVQNPHLPQDFRIACHESSSRDEIIQHRVPSHIANPSFPPVPSYIDSENALRNEPIRPTITSHAENPLPPVVNVTVPENSSRNSPNQTGVSVPPSGSPVLNTVNSWRDTPIQARVPFHMRSMDQFDIYGDFVAAKLRNLDSRSCAFVQTAFADLIFNAELGRFVSEGEQSFFANKTNNFLWNLPSNNPQRNVISNLTSSEAQPRFNSTSSDFCTEQVPLEVIPNLHSVQK